MNRCTVWLLVVAGAAFGGNSARKDERFFDERVAPILSRSCIGCHNHELDDGDISFEDRSTLLKVRRGKGAAVVPGKPEESPLIGAIRYEGEIQMPPGKQLSRQEIAILTEWIERGAIWGTKLHATRE